jgi:tetratricopeptide (TPR) repeat protein
MTRHDGGRPDSNALGMRTRLSRGIIPAAVMLATLAAFWPALHIDPNHASAHNDIGLIWAGQGRFAEAIAQYQHALKIDPNDAQAEHNLRRALKTGPLPRPR